MSKNQVAALGELIDSGEWDAAIKLCEANGFRFLKQYDSPYAPVFMVRLNESYKEIPDAVRVLYEHLKGAEA